MERTSLLAAVELDTEDPSGIFGRVRNLFSKDAVPAITASFTNQVHASRDAAYQILDQSSYDPETYWIELRIRDMKTGETISSRQHVILE